VIRGLILGNEVILNFEISSIEYRASSIEYLVSSIEGMYSIYFIRKTMERNT
jgi:hypothetical protein